MSKLTDYQKLILENLIEDGWWDRAESNSSETRSLNILLEKGYVKLVSYSNRDCWEPTGREL